MNDLLSSTHYRILSAALFLLLSGTACSSKKDDAPGPAGTIRQQGPGGGQGGNPIGGKVTVGDPEETRQQYCDGEGPPVGVEQAAGGGAAGSCEPGLASRIFLYGLCSCTDATFTGAFSIDAFDSALGPYQPGQLGGNVGINNQLHATGTVDMSGLLIVAGDAPLPITSGDFNIEGNLETNADLSTVGANIRFGRDLWVAGSVTAVGSSKVEGDVYQPVGQAAPSGITIGGQVINQDFEIAKPCACEPSQLLDIDAIVAAGKASAHNGEIGLTDDMVTMTGATDLDLACGRFAFEGSTLTGVTMLKVDGRTALFIDGDFTITGSFGIDLGTEGELDVFITGNLILTGSGEVGSPARPAALRFYVGGDGDIMITGQHLFAANLYAPRADVYVTGSDDIYGAFFVGSYTATGAQSMHYDSAVLRTPGGDEACKDCADLDEFCDGCSGDGDCQAPTVCNGGRCVYLSPD